VPHSGSDVRLNSDFTWNLTGIMNQANHQADVSHGSDARARPLVGIASSFSLWIDDDQRS
jgi:hypothetical protein